MGLTFVYTKGVFRTQSNIYGGASLRKSQECFIVDVRLSSKYTFGIGFATEKVYRMSTFILYGQSRFQKFVIAFLFLELIKNMFVSVFQDRRLYHKGTSPSICSANKWTSFYMIGTSAMNELMKEV